MKIILLTLFLLYLSPLGAIEVATFNTGLAQGFVPEAKERVEKVANYLSQEITSDVVCLQEVWNREDQDKILAITKEKFPYVVLPQLSTALASKAPICSVSELFGNEGVGRCLVQNCLTKKEDAFTFCVLDTCKSSIERLRQSNRECLHSLFSQVGKNPLAIFWNALSPLFRADSFAYEGRVGLMLLSKTPFKNSGTTDFKDFSTINRRAVIYGDVQNVTIACTHLGANLDQSVPYIGLLKSFEEENYKHVTLLSEALTPRLLKKIILGDFNCSLKNQKSESDFSRSCHLLFKNRVTTATFLKNECSYCTKNTLTRLDKGRKDLLIDHVLGENINIKKAEIDHQKNGISDHYLLKATLEIGN